MNRPLAARHTVAAFTICAIFTQLSPAAEINAQQSKNGVLVTLDGQPFAEYLIHSGTKPILWPIYGPSGKPLTRAYPMEKKSEKTKDHVHHRSLWFSHGDVNGIDFWTEVPAGKNGRIVHRRFVKIESGPQAVVITDNDWMSPVGKKVCEDQRRIAFGTWRGSRWIDLDITLRASEGAVSFGDTKEGSFALRVADSIRVDSKQGGQIVNSLGQTDATAWGQRADVLVQPEMEGRALG